MTIFLLDTQGSRRIAVAVQGLQTGTPFFDGGDKDRFKSAQTESPSVQSSTGSATEMECPEMRGGRRVQGGNNQRHSGGEQRF
jgi:hypothetical protein